MSLTTKAHNYFEVGDRLFEGVMEAPDAANYFKEVVERRPEVFSQIFSDFYFKNYPPQSYHDDLRNVTTAERSLNNFVEVPLTEELVKENWKSTVDRLGNTVTYLFDHSGPTYSPNELHTGLVAYGSRTNEPTSTKWIPSETYGEDINIDANWGFRNPDTLMIRSHVVPGISNRNVRDKDDIVRTLSHEILHLTGLLHNKDRHFVGESETQGQGAWDELEESLMNALTVDEKDSLYMYLTNPLYLHKPQKQGE